MDKRDRYWIERHCPTESEVTEWISKNQSPLINHDNIEEVMDFMKNCDMVDIRSLMTLRKQIKERHLLVPGDTITWLGQDSFKVISIDYKKRLVKLVGIGEVSFEDVLLEVNGNLYGMTMKDSLTEIKRCGRVNEEKKYIRFKTMDERNREYMQMYNSKWWVKAIKRVKLYLREVFHG